MNEKTSALLEFPIIKQRVADCAMSREAASLITASNPETGKIETEHIKELTAQMLCLMKTNNDEKREELPDIGFIISRLSIEGLFLETVELYALLIFIKRAGNLKTWLSKTIPDKNNTIKDKALLTYLEKLPPCESVGKEISRVIDAEGNLKDLPEFRKIKSRITALTKELEKTGSRYAGSDETRHMLQSTIPSQRDGRFVLAVKANFKGRIKGIVHEVSSTGQTVFIEPEEVVDRNNELFMEKRNLDAEIRKVLRELTGSIALKKETLEMFHSEIIFLESIRARARYGFETNGIFAEDCGDDAIVLNKARHPLLGSAAVPLDFNMTGNIRTVIITGPNTGGKTVALKTAGLLAMMNQFGLPLPIAEGSCIPVFDGIYADIGDEQSISQSLSTFSSHMTNIAAICGSAGEKSLVLLDELGSGTEPGEGGAIAMAILDYLIDKHSRLLVTTHHGVLKNYGYSREGVENASMEFDGQTLSPTYRIVMGIPGESRAVDIAARNGLHPDIIFSARTYLSGGMADVSALIKGLEDKHRELDSAAKVFDLQKAMLAEEQKKADLRELSLNQKEHELKTEGTINLRRLLEDSRKELENLVRELKEGEITRDKTLKVKSFISDLEEIVKEKNNELDIERKKLGHERRNLEKCENTAAPFGPGVEVLAGESRVRGRILRPDKKNHSTWLVEVGSLRMNYKESDLIPVMRSENMPQIKAGWSAEQGTGSAVSLELKLIGMRTEEALDALRRQIDAAVLSGLREFSVVHGKGDGILCKAVHDYLKTEKTVDSFNFSRPELGGFGRTEVVLKS